MKKLMIIAALVLPAPAMAIDADVFQFALATGRYIANAKGCGGLDNEWQLKFKSAMLLVNLKFGRAASDEFSSTVVTDANIVPPCNRDRLLETRNEQARLDMQIRTGVPQ
jgi:hypothetical protein